MKRRVLLLPIFEIEQEARFALTSKNDITDWVIGTNGAVSSKIVLVPFGDGFVVHLALSAENRGLKFPTHPSLAITLPPRYLNGLPSVKLAQASFFAEVASFC